MVYSCNQCEETFADQDSLNKHSDEHSDVKYYSCDQCPKSFPQNAQLKRHLRVHTGEKPYQCDKCLKSFSHLGNLKTHLRTHTDEKAYSCIFCSTSFAQERYLKQHIMNVHKGENFYSNLESSKSFVEDCMQIDLKCVKNEIVDTEDNKDIDTDENEDLDMDENCEMEALGASQNIKRNKRPKREKSDMQITGSYEVPDSNDVFPCNQCSKSFPLERKLKRHLRTHVGENVYECNQCSKSFSHIGKFKTHLRTHTGEKPYLCSECPKAFKHIDHLKNHERTHTGEKPFGCDQCPKFFADKGNLKKHLRTHSYERPYLCYNCPKAFAQERYLKQHILNTHKVEKNPSLQFAESLMRQEKTDPTNTNEKPYHCPECPKSFNHIAHLKTHLRTHSGEKPFSCELCSKCFVDKDAVKKHMKTHTDEKPFLCYRCPKAFALDRYLKQHFVSIHKGEKFDSRLQFPKSLVQDGNFNQKMYGMDKNIGNETIQTGITKNIERNENETLGESGKTVNIQTNYNANNSQEISDKIENTQIKDNCKQIDSIDANYIKNENDHREENIGTNEDFKNELLGALYSPCYDGRGYTTPNQSNEAN